MKNKKAPHKKWEDMTKEEKEIELQKMREETKQLDNQVAFTRGVAVGTMLSALAFILIKLLIQLI